MPTRSETDTRPVIYAAGAEIVHPVATSVVHMLLGERSWWCVAQWVREGQFAASGEERVVAECAHYRYRHARQRALWEDEEAGDDNVPLCSTI